MESGSSLVSLSLVRFCPNQCTPQKVRIWDLLVVNVRDRDEVTVGFALTFLVRFEDVFLY